MKVLERVGALLFLIRTLQRPLERLSIVAIKYLSGPKLFQQVIQCQESIYRNGGVLTPFGFESSTPTIELQQ